MSLLCIYTVPLYILYVHYSALYHFWHFWSGVKLHFVSQYLYNELAMIIKLKYNLIKLNLIMCVSIVWLMRFFFFKEGRVGHKICPALFQYKALIFYWGKHFQTTQRGQERLLTVQTLIMMLAGFLFLLLLTGKLQMYSEKCSAVCLKWECPYHFCCLLISLMSVTFTST